MNESKIARPLSGLAVTLFLPFAAGAADLGIEVSAGVLSSDNVARQATDEQSETVATAGANFSFEQRTRRMDAELVGDFVYNEYLDDTFDSELIGSFAGRSRVALVEDRLAWTLSDNFGQALTDPFQPEIPENRQNINYLSTGLEGGFLLGAQNRVGLGASYALATYETSPLDSATLGFDASYSRLIAPGNSLGFNVRSAQVRYDDDVTSLNDYEQREAFVRYAVTGARTRLSADGGYSSIDRDVGGSQSGALLRAEISRRLSSRSTLFLNLGQEFSNSASAFALTQGGADIDLNSVPGRQNAAPFTLRRASARWNLAGRRTNFGITAGVQEQEYDGSPLLDQKISAYSFDLRRDLSSVLSLDSALSFGQTRFKQAGADYDDVAANVGLSWGMARHLVVRFTYQYLDRDGDLDSNSYKENRFWLTLAYRRGQPANALRGIAFDTDSDESN